LSTFALETSSEAAGDGRAGALARYPDLFALALALPVFLLAGFPMLGYAVIAGVWLVQSAVQFAVDRHVARSLAGGKRNTALGSLAAATLGRVWIVALAILLVGLLAEREDGLAAAVLAAALVTAHLVGLFITRLVESEEGGR
jgi:hypothetical protein